MGKMNQAAIPAITTPQTLYENLATNRDRDMELLKTNLRDMRSQLHHSISSAPEIDKVLEEAQKIPFTSRISGDDMRHIGKLKLPTYDGKIDPRSHMTAFTTLSGILQFHLINMIDSSVDQLGKMLLSLSH